jgi:hypothetical protein
MRVPDRVGAVCVNAHVRFCAGGDQQTESSIDPATTIRRSASPCMTAQKMVWQSFGIIPYLKTLNS